MPTSLRSRRTTLALLLGATTLLSALTACTAPAANPAPSATSSTSSGLTGDAYTAAYHEYELQLAQCFRDQGLDVADPPADGFLDTSRPDLQAAFATCAAEIGDPPVQEVSQDERVEALEQNLERAECLREKGYDIVEPTLEDPGFVPAEVTDEDFEACRTD